MEEKTYHTAAVIIPPEELWEPIQAVRRRWDRHVRRWMPHITLIYPFRPSGAFPALQRAFSTVCRSVPPFSVTLAEWRYFRHGRGSCTLWLAPDQPAPLVSLQRRLQQLVPDCDEQSAFPAGYTPHLSGGQVGSEAKALRLRPKLQGRWKPLSFVVGEIALIWRGDPPRDVFRIAATVPLEGRT